MFKSKKQQHAAIQNHHLYVLKGIISQLNYIKRCYEPSIETKRVTGKISRVQELIKGIISDLQKDGKHLRKYLKG